MRLILAIFTLSLCPCVIWAQELDQSLPVVLVDDSTVAVDLVAFNLRILYPRPIEGSRKPFKLNLDGIVTIFLGAYSDKEMWFEIATQQTVRAHTESMLARERAGQVEFESEPLQTEQEFIQHRTIFQKGSSHKYFDNFEISRGRRYGVRSYFSELTSYRCDAVTYIDSLQLKLMINNKVDSLENTVYHFLQDTVHLSKASELSSRIMIQLFRERLHRFLPRFGIVKL